VTDIEAVAKLAKSIDAWTFVDNTFLTPALQKPLTLGADLVLHSATKFLSGHSDVVAGLAVARDEELADKLGFLQNAFGAILGVQDAWLVLRGLKTLHVRMEQSVKSAATIASFLEKHPLVKRVYYPGLVSHKGCGLQHRQAKSAGAVLSFELENEEALRTFVSNVEIPVFAVSLGAVESILSYPAKMSHAAMPETERAKRGISNALLRLSVGLEDEQDLIHDFEKALQATNVLKANVNGRVYHGNLG
jgi:cystathionine beta-lyase